MRTVLLAFILGAAVLPGPAQQPQTANTRLKVEAANEGLSAAMRRLQQSSGVLWAGYAVEALPQTHLSSCSSWGDSARVDDACCKDYLLEDPSDNVRTSDHTSSRSQNIFVLFRIDHGAISRVRLASAECVLNAGGLALHWLPGVQADESAVFLGELTAKNAEGEHGKLVDESLVAVSLHAASQATAVLASLASPPQSPDLREKAAFWLGAQRGHDGLMALRQIIAKEQEPRLREKLAFDLSINNDPGAIDGLIRMAKSDPNSGVRGQALFWLAEKAGKKAVGALRESAEKDPDFEVKKKAVFAMSQLPKDQSIEQLIQIADTNSNFAIRKEAIFWLGQTNDPRALTYLEAVLKR